MLVVATLAITMAHLLAASLPAAIIHTEDFEDDNVPGAPGFASTVFVHNIAGPNALITAPFFPTPSPPHALFLGAVTTDFVTFVLAPGEEVESASLWMTGTGGGWAGVSFVGSMGSVDFTTFSQDNFQFFSVDPSNGIGDVVSIVLGVGPPISGQEALYDNISIRVVPEPGSALMVMVGLPGFAFSRRRGRPGIAHKSCGC